MVSLELLLFASSTTAPALVVTGEFDITCPVAGFFGSGKSAEELPEHSKRGFDAAPKSVWEPAERLKEQDRDGVSAEALYTSMGMLLFGLNDGELRTACFRAFNDYAAEYCSYDPKRLIGLGAITAVVAMEVALALGIRQSTLSVQSMPGNNLIIPLHLVPIADLHLSPPPGNSIGATCEPVLASVSVLNSCQWSVVSCQWSRN